MVAGILQGAVNGHRGIARLAEVDGKKSVGRRIPRYPVPSDHPDEQHRAHHDAGGGDKVSSDFSHARHARSVPEAAGGGGRILPNNLFPLSPPITLPANMKIHEYQARQILSENGVPVPPAEVVYTPDAAGD